MTPNQVTPPYVIYRADGGFTTSIPLWIEIASIKVTDPDYFEFNITEDLMPTILLTSAEFDSNALHHWATLQYDNMEADSLCILSMIGDEPTAYIYIAIVDPETQMPSESLTFSRRQFWKRRPPAQAKEPSPYPLARLIAGTSFSVN